MDSREIKWHQTEKLNKDRHQLTWILIVCGFNVLILLSLAFDFRWWKGHEKICFIIGFFYFFLYMAYTGLTRDERGKLFEIGHMRLRHWRDYYTSEVFIKQRYYGYDYAPIRNGGYVCIKECDEYGRDIYEYVRFMSDGYQVGMDIDCNKVYNLNMRLVDLRNNQDIFRKSDRVYSTGDLLNEMYKTLEKDGKKIIATYNEYGDVMWSLSDKPTKKLLYRKIYYYVALTLWYIVALIAFIAPMIPMIRDNHLI